MAWLNFLDLRSLPVKEAEAVILPIPYEATTTYGAGARQGPEAILAASRQVELWVRSLSPGAPGLADFGDGRRAHPDRKGPGGLRR